MQLGMQYLFHGVMNPDSRCKEENYHLCKMPSANCNIAIAIIGGGWVNHEVYI